MHNVHSFQVLAIGARELSVERCDFLDDQRLALAAQTGPRHIKQQFVGLDGSNRIHNAKDVPLNVGAVSEPSSIEARCNDVEDRMTLLR